MDNYHSLTLYLSNFPCETKIGDCGWWSVRSGGGLQGGCCWNGSWGGLVVVKRWLVGSGSGS